MLFPIQIAEGERDKHLGDKLKAEEGPGILRWIIDGALTWQRIGLAPPKTVRAASEDYFAAQDLFGQWLDDECETDEPDNDNRWVSTGGLFASWTSYAEQANEEPGSVKAFSEQMQARGFKKCMRGNRNVRAFSGIRLKPAPPSVNWAKTD